MSAEEQKGGITLEVKIDPKGKGDFQDWLDQGLRRQLLAGAVEHIVKELTPERLKAWATSLLDDAFKGVHLYNIQEELRKLATPYVNQMLAQPVVQERIKKLAEESVEKAITALPDEIKKALAEKIAEAIRRYR